jgi:nitronate monooxygenase
MQNEKIAHIKQTLEIPVIMAPMFLISNPKMVINACAAGIVGTFPALNARTGKILESWMKEITVELNTLKQETTNKKIGPWGINLIVHQSNKRYVEDLQLIKKYQPPVVITSLGDPGPVAEIVHAYGGIVFSDVINLQFAKKAIEKGADGLVLVAGGAGGHAGTFNPISFVHEVREFFTGPIALSGGMSKGEDILVTELLGADLAYIGTRFITAAESTASDRYKQTIVDSTIEDIIYTDAFTGINANYLIPSIIESGLDPDKLQRKNAVDFSELGNNHAKAWKDIWGAGQGIGPITRLQTVAEIVEELKEGYSQATEMVANKNREAYQ